MKISKIAMATTAAIYAFAVGAAANNTNNSSQGASAVSQLRTLDISIEQLRAQAKSKAETRIKQPQSAVKRVGGVNRHIERLTPQRKFTPEADITGVHSYIVRFRDKPVATYNGGIKGLAATAPRTALANQAGRYSVMNANAGKLFSSSNPNRSNIQAYKSHLLAKQDDFLATADKMGVDTSKSSRFTTALNGVSVKMTQQQAIEMAKLSEVAHIERSRLLQLQTDEGPSHIGANQIWSGQATQEVGYKGEGVIVGIIDTGVNTDHPSFADIGGDNYDHNNPWGEGVYSGDCAKEEYALMCNDKLIGVHSFEVITDNYLVENPDQPWGPKIQLAPPTGEDYSGHGSHTASTTAGNTIFNAPLQGASLDGNGKNTGFTFDRVSGVAPHANIISYQVCHPSGSPQGGCPSEAILLGIEKAIEDGVDVINFSIGGQESFPWEDEMELAFLAAREAGVSVAASAGNSGRNGHYSTDHTSPWLLSVAATTHARSIDVTGKGIEAMSGGETTPPSDIEGAGISGAFSGEFVLAADFGDELCLEPFPEGTFTADQIVVCKRGEIARVAKASNVAAGGAGGFVLYNTSWSEKLVNDVYDIPGVHISRSSGSKLVRWLQKGSSHRGTITASEINRGVNPEKADILADFSSLGPSATNPNHLVPAVAAPGVDIYAANADQLPFATGAYSSDWTVMSGTSMAGPHVAGAMALLKQARPDWSAAEIQSALQMTAYEGARFHSDVTASLEPATVYHAGSGRIDVAAAVKAGLIMDETLEGFIAANPNNGGDPKALNMPELVNMACRESCTWVRTVKATVDGSWSAEGITNEFSVDISVTPAQFSLKAGETQSIVVTAKVMDSQTRIGNSELEVHGKVVLTPESADVPAAHWPVAMKYDHGTLPEAVNVVAHRDNDSFTVANLQAPTIVEFTSRTYQPVEATMHTLELTQDDDPILPFYDDEVDGPADATIWVDVPDNAVRFIAETIARSATTAKDSWEAGDVDITIGYDVNGDNQIQMQEEAICLSTAVSYKDYCNINDPKPGRYWVQFHNFPHYAWYSRDAVAPIDTYEVATAVVLDETATDLTVTGPANNSALESFDVALNWDLAEFPLGSLYYSAFDLGTDPANSGNIGFVPFKLSRGENDVSIKTSQTAARVGDIIDVKIHVLPNNSGAERNFDLASVIPEGLSVVPDSVQASHAVAEGLTVDGNSIALAGSQADSADLERDYIVTTSLDDAMCRTPDFGPYYDGSTSDGGYVDLAKFGIDPQWGGDWTEGLELPLNWFWPGDNSYALYNNGDQVSYPSLKLFPMGHVQLDDMPLFFHMHMPFPYKGFPDSLIGAFWRGLMATDRAVLQTPYAPNPWVPDDASGMSFAFTGDKKMVVEWDNARTQEKSHRERQEDGRWKWIYSDRDDSYDFELIMDLEGNKYDKGQYELIMSYDNLDFGSQTGEGSIGLQGFYGPRGFSGPTEGYKGTSYAYNDLKEKLSDNLVVCYDYVGPESSLFDLSFQVRVDEMAAGQTLPINFSNKLEGVADVEVLSEIAVHSNLKIGEIRDYRIDEDSKLEDVMVAYSDNDQGVNTIVVEGEHVSGVVHGGAPGSLIDIIPDADFSGETQVTVTVHDKLYPSDSASTSFTLMVDPVMDAPVAAVAASDITVKRGTEVTLDASSSSDPDGDVLNYSWSQTSGDSVVLSDAESAIATIADGTLAVGEYLFEVTVSDGEQSSTAKVKVTATNRALIAKVVNATIKITEGDTVTLDASASIDADGDMLSFDWEGDGDITDTTAASTTVSGLSEGTHEFTVTVSDGYVTETATVTVIVAAPQSQTQPEPQPQPEPESKSSGGSFGWLLAGLALVGLGRRKKLNKPEV